MATEQEQSEPNSSFFLGLFCCWLRESNRVQPVNINQTEKSSSSQNPSSLVNARRVNHPNSNNSVEVSVPDSTSSKPGCSSVPDTVREPEEDLSSMDCGNGVSVISRRSWRHQAGWFETSPSDSIDLSRPLELVCSMNQDTFNAILPRRRNAICEELEKEIDCAGLDLVFLREALTHANDATTYS